MNLKIHFSKESELNRIRYTLEKLDWFLAQGYKINLPVKIRKMVDQKRAPTDEEILEAVSDEFNQEEYKDTANNLTQGWEKSKDDFFKKLKTLGLPLQTEYAVSFTKYGVGGSYGLPNKVQINFDYSYAKDILTIIRHEIVHITIENLIREHDIDHWTKERLVDLVYSKFFPAEKRTQRDPKKSEQIDVIFNQFFPDMKKIILEIDELNKKIICRSDIFK